MKRENRQIPVSGLPRDKTFSELTDDQVRAFCDYNMCLGDNGYNDVCTLAEKEQFRLEADPIFEQGAITCYPMPRPYFGQYGNYESREACVSLFREFYNQCHVGLLEDCVRETIAAPVTSRAYLPSCRAREVECG